TFLHKRAPKCTMPNPRGRVEYVHISLRIPTSLKESLEKDASRDHMNLNSLVSKILVKYSSFDKIADLVGAIPLNTQLFGEMLNSVPQDRMESIGKEIGPKLIRQTFTLLGIEYDIDSLIQYYFEPLAAYSRWYRFYVVGTSPNRRLMFEHSHGGKWSAFLRHYITGIIKSATGAEPKTTVSDDLVTVFC
ncbi:MAG: hypothetical protein OK456_11405, partial [Thaumarchaeota archaeon]|nr:hypothetical protein [Nitrososphaerota archaeon]